MTTEQFAYWLQGFCEIHGDAPNAVQWEMIKEHLQTCFVKVTGDKSTEPRHEIYQDIPDWLKKLNQQGTGAPIFPPGTITC